MQKKQAKQVSKPKAGAKPAKTAAKPAAKTASKGAPAKAAAKGAAKSATKGAAKAPAKAVTKATKVAAPARKPAAAPASKPAVRPAAREDAARSTKSTSRSVVKPASRHRHDDTSSLPVPIPKAPVVAAIVPRRSFSFEDAGRTFNARVEPLRPSGTDAWWWFDVSTEQHQRHAPFRAEPGDSLETVQARIVKYYDELLARRAEPAPSRWNRRPSTPGTPAVTAPAEGAEDEETPPDEEGAELEGEEGAGDEPEMVGLEEAEGIAEDATA
jgi:hypothetical protein